MSQIVNLERYLYLIKRILNNSAIDLPKNSRDLFKIRLDKNGKILGWEINNKRVYFYNGDFLMAKEKAIYKRLYDSYLFECYSYHFNPNIDSKLHSYRIDFNTRQGLHVNDERNGENNHITSDQLRLDISNFNLYLAINLCLLYISKGKYPFDNINFEEYNLSITTCRRECNG